MKIAIICVWTGTQPQYLPKVIENHQQFANQNGFTYIFKHLPILSDEETNSTGRISEGIRVAVWNQITEAQKILNSNNFDYVMKIDSDAIFGNMKFDVNSILSKNKSFFFTGDISDIFNGGNWIMRTDDFCKILVEDWLRFSRQKFELLNTSHQTPDGRLSDQPAMNILLRVGIGANFEELNEVEVFNLMNGFSGNPDRRFRYFHRLFAPTKRINLFLASMLINRRIRKNVSILPQRTLNSYETRITKDTFVIHFAGARKHELASFLSSLEVNFETNS